MAKPKPRTRYQTKKRLTAAAGHLEAMASLLLTAAHTESRLRANYLEAAMDEMANARDLLGLSP